MQRKKTELLPTGARHQWEVKTNTEVGAGFKERLPRGLVTPRNDWKKENAMRSKKERKDWMEKNAVTRGQ